MSIHTTVLKILRWHFGQALRQAFGDKAGIRRFGDAMVPLDEVLVQAAVDLRSSISSTSPT